MKRIVNVKISDSLAVECKELTLGQIMGLVSKLDPDRMPNEGFFGYIQGVLSNELIPLTTNLEVSQLLDFTPSELAAVYDGIKEANKDFFTVVASLNLPALIGNVIQMWLGQALNKVEKTVLTTTGVSSASSISADTPTPLSTDTPTQ